MDTSYTQPLQSDDGYSDEALMFRYSSGDPSAFDTLYMRHRNGLYRFILRHYPQKAQAEEIFQEVWVNLIKHRNNYRSTAKFRTYLYTIAHHRMIDGFRRHARSEDLAALVSQSDSDEILANIPGSRVDEPDVKLAAKEQSIRFLNLLDSLPIQQKEVFLLYEEGGLSVEDIAQATGVSFETAKSRLRYAVKKLREGLKEIIA